MEEDGGKRLGNSIIRLKIGTKKFVKSHISLNYCMHIYCSSQNLELYNEIMNVFRYMFTKYFIVNAFNWYKNQKLVRNILNIHGH